VVSMNAIGTDGGKSASCHEGGTVAGDRPRSGSYRATRRHAAFSTTAKRMGWDSSGENSPSAWIHGVCASTHFAG
jgi:hypothetical protein